MRYLITIVFVFVFTSCSFKSSTKSSTESDLVPDEVVSSEILDDSDDGVLEFQMDKSNELYEVVQAKEGDMEGSTIMDSAPVINEEPSRSIASVVEEERYETYIIQQGDTLMKIAFNTYRDIKKWKEIAAWNEESLNGKTRIFPGDSLKLKVIDNEGIVWNPEGNPYLIEKGDSLMTISSAVYSTVRYWKDIWRNNLPLIHDPDIIYAGFTLYYLDLEVLKNKRRELASMKAAQKKEQAEILAQ